MAVPYKLVAVHLYSPGVLAASMYPVAAGILVPSLLHENVMRGSPEFSRHVNITCGVMRHCGRKPIEIIEGERLHPSSITGGTVWEKDYLTLDKIRLYAS